MRRMHRIALVAAVLAVLAGGLASCAAVQSHDEGDAGWRPLSEERPELAGYLADPHATAESVLSITYTYEGYAPITVALSDEQVEEALVALADIEVGAVSDTRWDDYGDVLSITLASGETVRLAFEGHAVLVDEADHRQAFEVRGTDGLWALAHALIEQEEGM